MEEREVSFEAYVVKRFGTEIGLAVKNYINKHRKKMIKKCRTKDVRSVDDFTVSNIALLKMRVLDLPDMDLHIEVVVAAEMMVVDAKREDVEEPALMLFSVFCRGDLACALNDFAIQEIAMVTRIQSDEEKKPLISLAQWMKRGKWYLSDDMVPIISEKDLEDTSEAFLRLYYPEALRAPMAIDPYVLAERMGLSVVSHRIDKSLRVYGQIYFCEVEAALYDEERDATTKLSVQPGTIVVDEKANYLRNVGTFRSTIVHECVHWRMHRKNFMMERLARGEDATAIRCCEDGTVLNARDRRTQEMELQATMLTPRILMPRKVFKKKANELLMGRSKRAGIYLCDLMPQVIEQLAECFGVSPTAAKLRLIEVGYPQAEGALIEVNGRVVPPHTWREGTLAENETFTIPAEAAILLMLKEPRMREAAQWHVYIDGHFVFNDPRYVEWSQTGQAKMTDYARHHMDECCLRFSISMQDETETPYAREYVLNRNTSLIYELNYELDEADDTQKLSENEKMDRILRAKQEEFALLKELKQIEQQRKEEIDQKIKDELAEALEKEIAKLPEKARTNMAIAALTQQLQMEIMKKNERVLKYPPSKEWTKLIHLRGMNQPKLAGEIDLSTEQVKNAINLKTKNLRLETLLYMCLALNLPPMISRYMIERSHVVFCPEDNGLHFTYDQLLTVYYSKPFKETKEALKRYGITP